MPKALGRTRLTRGSALGLEGWELAVLLLQLALDLVAVEPVFVDDDDDDEFNLLPVTTAAPRSWRCHSGFAIDATDRARTGGTPPHETREGMEEEVARVGIILPIAMAHKGRIIVAVVRSSAGYGIARALGQLPALRRGWGAVKHVLVVASRAL